MPYFTDKSGTVTELTPEEALGSGGDYRPSTAQEVAPILQRAELEKQYGGVGQGAIAGLEGAAQSLSLGLSTPIETGLLGVDPAAIAARETVHPGAHLAGEAAGVIAPLLATGGTSLLAQGAKRTGPALLAELGGIGAESAGALAKQTLGKTAASALGRTVVATTKRAAGSAIEGAVYGLGHDVHEYHLGDPDLNGELLVAGQKVAKDVGMGALLGGGIGAGSGLLGSAARAAAPHVATWLDDVADSQIGKAVGIDDKGVVRQLRRAGLISGFPTPEKLAATAAAAEKDLNAKLADAMQGHELDQALYGRVRSSKAVDELREKLDLVQKAKELAEVGKAVRAQPGEGLGALELLGGLHSGIPGAIVARAGKEAMNKFGPGLAGMAADAGADVLSGGSDALSLSGVAPGVPARTPNAGLSPTDPVPTLGVQAGTPGATPEKTAALSALERHTRTALTGLRDAASEFLDGKASTSTAAELPPALESIARVHQLASSPGALLTEVAKHVDDVEEHAPKIAQSAAGTLTRGMAYLKSVAPQGAPGTPLSGPGEPMPGQQRVWQERVQAVLDPIAVLRSNGITQPQVETLNAVYPSLLSQYRAELASEVAGRTSVPAAARIGLSRVMGQPMDAGQSPGQLANVQQLMLQSVAAGHQAKQARGRARASRKLTAGDRVQTDVEKTADV